MGRLLPIYDNGPPNGGKQNGAKPLAKKIADLALRGSVTAAQPKVPPNKFILVTPPTHLNVGFNIARNAFVT